LPTGRLAFYWNPTARRSRRSGSRRRATTRWPAQVGRRSSPRGSPLRPPSLPSVRLSHQRRSGAIRSNWTFPVSDVFVNQVLPFFDQYALSHNLWSPDGASFALPVVAADGSDVVMIVQADGSGARAVARGVAAFWSPPLPR
jgi:hypothetical protein